MAPSHSPLCRAFRRVKQRSIGSVSPHVWLLPLVLNLWLFVFVTGLILAVHLKTEGNNTSFGTFTVLAVLVCPLSLVWLKLAVQHYKVSADRTGRTKPAGVYIVTSDLPSFPKSSSKCCGVLCNRKSSTTMLVLSVNENQPNPLYQVAMSVVCVLVILRVLFLLLLLAGDVERNPGPTIVTVDKVAELVDLLVVMAACWNVFLGQLGVPRGKLDQVQLQSIGQPNRAQYCLTRGLHHWVVSDDNPTYEKIIAVFNGKILPNRPLARKVEEFMENVGCPTRVTENRVDQLAGLLDDIAAIWYILLGQLGVSPSVREQTRVEAMGVPNPSRYCLTRGLHVWIMSDDEPTYEKVVRVLSDHLIGRKDLAMKVEQFASDIKDKLTKGELLGRGSYGYVSVMHNESGEVVCAGKFPYSVMIDADEHFRKKFVHETEIWSHLHHSNIVRYIGSLSPPKSEEYCLLMELMHCSLHHYICQAERSVKVKLLLLLDVAKALSYLHGCTPAIVHCDLTASNVLLTSGDPPVAKIADFGNCRVLNRDARSQIKSNPGTPFYMPPEALERYGTYDGKLDIFSFGHLALFTFTQTPITDLLRVTVKCEDGMYRVRSEVDRRQEYFEKLNLPTSHPVVAVMKECLSDDPKARPSAEALVRRLEVLSKEHTNAVIAEYADLMRAYYRTAVPQCFSLTWPPSPTRKVFNLSMISHKRYNYGRGNDELVRLLHLGNVDQVMARKSTVELKDLFHLDEAKRKVVLIEGAPGAGKSTLAWHICQKWKSGELFQEFKLVVFVQLRDPAIQSAKSLADLFPAQLKSVAREVVSRMETKGGEGVLFVLDGWDEFPPGLCGNELIKNLICYPSAIAMPSSTLLITSRPIASGDLHRYASSRVETIGFKQAELILYFKDALKNDSKRVQELHDCLKQRPVIKASCYLPLNTVIVAHLFISLDNRLPNTLHGVFLQLVIHCIVRHFMKQQDGDSGPPHISSLDDLPPDMQTQLSHICAMAYHGVMKSKVTFSEDDLKSFNLPPDIDTLSLIQVVVSFMPYRSRSYNFLHRSIQELLTAYHISKLPPEEQVKIFKELFGQPRFAAVFQHYAAFTKLRTAGIWKIVTSMISNNKKVYRLTLFNCLYEAQDFSLCQFVASELKGKLDLSNNTLRPVDCIAVGYFLHQCAALCPMAAKLSKCSLDSYKLELLVKELKRPILTDNFNFCIHIDFSANNVDGNLTQVIATELTASASDDTSIIAISNLDLSDNPIQDGEDGLFHLCRALSTNTSLVELNLSDCQLTITEENGQALNHMLKTNKTLSVFTLSNNSVNGCGVRYLSEGISSSSAISKLDLSGNPIQDGEDGLSHLCHAVTTNTSLVELNLSDCKLCEACGTALCHMLEANSTLTLLDLSRNELSKHNVASIAEGLRSNHSLKCLDLRWCGICDREMKSLAHSLTVNDSLEEVKLYNDTISPEAARGFSDMLKRNSSLKKLNVSRSELTDEAVKSLASALEVNSTLQELDVSRNNHVSDTALVALGESLKRNSELKTLGVGLPFKTTANGWRQFLQCLEDNRSLELLRTHHRELDVEDVNTVRREKNLPELRHEQK